MKRCSKCKTEKDEGEFHKDKYKVDGLRNWCATCCLSHNKEYKKKNYKKEKKQIDVKVCARCNIEKLSSEFYADNSVISGLRSECKQCCWELRPSKEKAREYSHKSRHKNKGKITEVLKEKTCSKCKETKEVRFFNKDKYSRNGYTNQCKECRSKNTRRYLESDHGKEKKRQYYKQKRERDIGYKLHKNISRQISYCINKEGVSSLEYLPFTIGQLKEHLEKQFEDWMNWENYGSLANTERTWNIDHIIPRCKLKYDSFEHENFFKCWKLSNLRPLCSLQNTKKGGRLEER